MVNSQFSIDDRIHNGSRLEIGQKTSDMNGEIWSPSLCWGDVCCICVFAQQHIEQRQINKSFNRTFSLFIFCPNISVLFQKGKEVKRRRSM